MSNDEIENDEIVASEEAPGTVEPDDAQAVQAGSDEEDVSMDMSLELEKYKKLAQENFKMYQYSIAELDNLKKRALQDRRDFRKYGIVPFVKEILSVVDNLERALEHIENADKDSLIQGINMTLKQFNKTLEQYGISQISAKGMQFDPNIHDAFAMVESHEHEPNTVMEELQKGYILDDRLIRPSRVTVSTLPKYASEKASFGEREEEKK